MKSPTSAPFSDISTDEFFGCYLVALLSCVCCAFIAKRRYRKDAAALSLTRWTSEEVLTFTLHNAIAGIWAVILLAGHERPTPLSILQVIAFDMAYALWDLAHIFLRRLSDAAQLIDRITHHIAVILIIMELFYVPFDPYALCLLSASVNLSGALVGVLRLALRWQCISQQPIIQSVIWAVVAGVFLSSRLVLPVYTLAPIFFFRWPYFLTTSRYPYLFTNTPVDWDSFLRDCFLYAVGVLLVLNGLYICAAASRAVSPFRKMHVLRTTVK